MRHGDRRGDPQQPELNPDTTMTTNRSYPLARLACTLPALLSLATLGPARADEIMYLGNTGYIYEGELVQYSGNTIFWRGGNVIRLQGMTIGTGWDTYPGGRAVLLSQLVPQPPSEQFYRPRPLSPQRMPYPGATFRHPRPVMPPSVRDPEHDVYADPYESIWP